MPEEKENTILSIKLITHSEHLNFKYKLQSYAI